MTDEALGPGAEFDLIRMLADTWGTRAVGIGDDAAILPSFAEGEHPIVSVDATVENRHFSRGWLSARDLGWRATMAALSDLAAMGATPTGVFVALAIPDSWRREVGEIACGIGEAVARENTVIRGGNVTAAGELSITMTVVGAARRPLRRDGAQPGDDVWVTGALGGPVRALRALEGGTEPEPGHYARFAEPTARIEAGRWLALNGATAAIDISDGLNADLLHLASASHVAIEVEAAAIPLVPGATVEDALGGGEEYELVAATRGAVDVEAFTRETGLRLTRIGRVVAGEPGVRVHGARVEFAPGHDHFSR